MKLDVKNYVLFFLFCPLLLLIFSESYATSLSQSIVDNPKLVCAAGSYSDGMNTLPFLLTNTIGSGKQNWSFVSNIAPLPKRIYDLSINQLNCIGHTCVVVGEWRDQHLHTSPLLWITRDNGQSFKFVQDILNFPISSGHAVLHDVKCTGADCIAVGESSDGKDHYPLLLITSHDDGQSWQYITNITGLPVSNASDLQQVHCSDKTCLAVGYIHEVDRQYSQPLILKSNYGGQTWSYITNIGGLPYNLVRVDKSKLDCFNNTCIWGGTYYTYEDKDESSNPYHEYPFLLVSKDKGTSWKMINSIGKSSISTRPGHIYTVKCMAQNICMVGGAYNDVNDTLIFWISTDSGETWNAIKDFHRYDEIKDKAIFSISCTDKFCFAVGGGPLLLRSTNKGQTWTIIESIQELPPYVHLSQVHCIKDRCFAVGQYKTEYDSVKWLPLLLASYDSGLTWKLEKNIDNLPTYVERGELSAI